jgi:hypothetical protein
MKVDDKALRELQQSEDCRASDAIYKFFCENLREPNAMVTASQVARIVTELAIPIAAASLAETAAALRELRSRCEAIETKLKSLMN